MSCLKRNSSRPSTSPRSGDQVWSPPRKNWPRLAGKAKRSADALTVAKDELLEIAYEVAGDRIEAAIYAPSKVERARRSVAAPRRSRSRHQGARIPKPPTSRSSQAFEYLQKKAFRISILDKGERADGRGDRRSPPALRRSRHCCPAFARLRPLRPWRNPGARHHHAGSADEKPGLRQLRRWRGREALHPALQLPSLLRR